MTHRLAALLLLSLLLPGCASVTSTSQLDPSGSLQRTVRIEISNAEMSMGQSNAPTPAQIADLPGDGWKIEEGTGKEGKWLTATRTIQPGTSGDYGLKDKASAPYLRCTVSVTPLASGRFEYTETYEWVGKAPKSKMAEEPSEFFNAALGGFRLTEQDREAIVGDMRTGLWKLMFGPGDPLITTMLMNSPAGKQRARSAMASTMLQALERHLGNRTTHQERVDAVRKAVPALDSEELVDKQSAPDPTGNDEEQEPGFVPITVVLRAPGKIIESNGVEDHVLGEVSWSMYDLAAVHNKVILRAVVESGAGRP